MTEWKNVLQLVVSTLGNEPESGAIILDLLTVLPEEVTEGRKITLTVSAARTDPSPLGQSLIIVQEDELRARTKELLEDNAAQVLQLLVQYAQSSGMRA